MNETGPKLDASRLETPTERRVERAVREFCGVEEDLACIAAKIQEKLDWKDKVVTDDGTNDWDEWKRLGIFIVNSKYLDRKMIDILRANGVDIYADERVLELHIPPQSIEERDRLLSLARLAEYLDANFMA